MLTGGFFGPDELTRSENWDAILIPRAFGLAARSNDCRFGQQLCQQRFVQSKRFQRKPVRAFVAQSVSLIPISNDVGSGAPSRDKQRKCKGALSGRLQETFRDVPQSQQASADFPNDDGCHSLPNKRSNR